MKQPAILACARMFLCLGSSAQAHQIWLEQTPEAASLYFGEYDRNLRESSPDSLEQIAAPAAMSLNGGSEYVLTFNRTGNARILRYLMQRPTNKRKWSVQ